MRPGLEVQSDVGSTLPREPAVAAVVRSWRRLTTPDGKSRAGPGQPTLVACSGGADSCALVLALASVADAIVVGHVVHDLRPAAEALADRDAVRSLADRLGLPFEEAHVRVRGMTGAHSRKAGGGGTNLESLARRARYGALEEMALRRGLSYVATAHHADDQLETVLMALLRGTGVSGLAGAAVKRPLRRGLGARKAERTPDAPDLSLTLIRPLIDSGLSREDCRRICTVAGWSWREDATNTDTTRLRAAVRAEILPRLKKLRPGVERCVSRTAALCRDAAELERAACVALWNERIATTGPEEWMWTRARLRSVPASVLGSLLRRVGRMVGVGEGQDRLGSRALGAAVNAIRDRTPHQREFEVGRLRVVVGARQVTLGARVGRPPPQA